MITEDYVGFETAKLLKEKGFIIPYDSFRGVYINGMFKRLNPGTGYGYNSDDEVIAVCSLQLAMKWLREVHKICISVDVKIGGGKYYVCISSTESGLSHGVLEDEVWNTFEEACESAIKYCLEKLI